MLVLPRSAGECGRHALPLGLAVERHPGVDVQLRPLARGAVALQPDLQVEGGVGRKRASLADLLAHVDQAQHADGHALVGQDLRVQRSGQELGRHAGKGVAGRIIGEATVAFEPPRIDADAAGARLDAGDGVADEAGPTPQQAAAYVASLPGQQFAAPYALCASVLAGTSLRRGEALTTMRAPDDQGEAALLAVVSAGVAKASAEAGEAVAAKAATKFAAACSSAAKGAEPDASRDTKNLLSADFVADAQEAPLPPPPPKAGPKIIAPKAAFDGTDSEPGTAKEAVTPPAAEAPSLTLAEVNKFTVPKLKAALKERNLPVTGLKAVLKARLLEALGYDA